MASSVTRTATVTPMGGEDSYSACSMREPVATWLPGRWDSLLIVTRAPDPIILVISRACSRASCTIGNQHNLQLIFAASVCTHVSSFRQMLSGDDANNSLPRGIWQRTTLTRCHCYMIISGTKTCCRAAKVSSSKGDAVTVLYASESHARVRSLFGSASDAASQAARSACARGKGCEQQPAGPRFIQAEQLAGKQASARQTARGSKSRRRHPPAGTKPSATGNGARLVASNYVEHDNPTCPPRLPSPRPSRFPRSPRPNLEKGKLSLPFLGHGHHKYTPG